MFRKLELPFQINNYSEIVNYKKEFAVFTGIIVLKYKLVLALTTTGFMKTLLRNSLQNNFF